MDKMSIEVLQMSRQFIYWPLYYAISKDFFGYLQTAQGGPYKISRARLVSSSTDEGVFRSLLNREADELRNVKFGIGDPRSLLESNANAARELVIVGALVTGTAFWAVDHRRETTGEVSDLASFEKVVSYKRGTTSYDLAKTIVAGSFPPREIIEVEPRQEFEFLRKEQDHQTIVLSPDILLVAEALRDNKRLGIELHVGKQHDYSDILITAIVTTRDVVLQHQGLVKAFLKGIQHALLEVRARTPSFVEYAVNYEHCDAKTLFQALDHASESRVYPETVQVNQALWMRLVASPVLNGGKEFSSDERKAAREVYDRIAKPYEHIAQEAVVELLQFSNAGESSKGTNKQIGLDWRPPANALVITFVSFLAFAVLIGTNHGGGHFVKWLLAAAVCAFHLFILRKFDWKDEAQKSEVLMFACGYVAIALGYLVAASPTLLASAGSLLPDPVQQLVRSKADEYSLSAGIAMILGGFAILAKWLLKAIKSDIKLTVRHE